MDIEQVFTTGSLLKNLKAQFQFPSSNSQYIFFRMDPLLAIQSREDKIILTFRVKQQENDNLLSGDDSITNDHQHLFEALPEGVFTIDTQRRLSKFNQTAEKITGFRQEEVIGRYCWQIFKSDLCQIGCPLRNALDQGIITTDQDVRIITKQGRKLSILVNVGVLKDHRGNISGAIETFRLLVGERIKAGQNLCDYTFSDIMGKSPAISHLFSILPDVAVGDANVLICGESGTGKDLLAHTIHAHSSRKNKPFIAVNCTALAESLLESEMFGHEKAAFTGAANKREGRFEIAAGGTINLDEIGELKPEIQIKLLRVLEQREFERVGGTQTIPIKARIIAATNKDLHTAMAQGKFREDLYYRLRTIPITIAPLRERSEDIPLLIDHFIEKLNRQHKKRVHAVSPDVMAFLKKYHWPGNIRELERTLEYVYVFVKGTTILKKFLPATKEFGVLNMPQPSADLLDKANLSREISFGHLKKPMVTATALPL